MSAEDRATRLKEFAEAAVAANAIERRNRPTVVVVAATLVLGAGVIFALWSVGGQVRAGTLLENAANTAREVQEKAVAARALQSSPAREQLQARYQPETQLRTKLQAAGDALGLERLSFGNLRDERYQADSPLVRKVIDVTMTGVTPQAGLDWIDQVREDVPGLEVAGLELRPDASGWTFRVRVARWEMSR